MEYITDEEIARFVNADYDSDITQEKVEMEKAFQLGRIADALEEFTANFGVR